MIPDNAFDRECNRIIHRFTEVLEELGNNTKCTKIEQESVMLYACCRVLAIILHLRYKNEKHLKYGLNMIEKNIILIIKELEKEKK